MKSSVPKEGVNEIRRKFLKRVSSEGIYRLYDEIEELKRSIKEIKMGYIMETQIIDDQSHDSNSTVERQSEQSILRMPNGNINDSQFL